MTDGQAKRTRVPTYLAVPAVAAALAVSILGWLRYESARHVVSAGFVFDDVMFEVPAQMAQRLGGALSNDEQERIAAISYSELVHAYSGLRIEFSDRRDALYVVRVLQALPDQQTGGAVARSHVLAPLGGRGIVSFLALAHFAVEYAPEGSTRAAIIDGIGRGIGRAAAHEFAHHLLVSASIDASLDRASYEYATADRLERYYGPIHWDSAWPLLVQRLGVETPH